MELASLEAVKYLCNQYHVRPDKRSGQNFLVDAAALRAVVTAAGLSSDDVVLEIGPGFGTLTTELAERSKRVLAVEMDRRFIPALKKLALVHKPIAVYEGDIFRLWPLVARELTDLEYKLVANLPYNITSSVIRHFLEQQPRPSQIIVMVQREVAVRVCAKPGEFSLLSLAAQLYGVPEIIAPVNRKSFWPEPDVDSAVLKIDRIGQDDTGVIRHLGPDGVKKLWQIARIGFSSRRKQLHNNLAAGLRLPDKKVRKMLEKIGYNPMIRAQELAPKDWAKITLGF